MHRRNRGTLTRLDWRYRLLEPELSIDSLDLAEIVAVIEKQFAVSLFDLPVPPRTWDEVRVAITGHWSRARGAD